MCIPCRHLGSGGIAPLIPKITLDGPSHLSPFTLGKVPQYPLTGWLGGTQTWCGCFGVKQSLGPATQFLSSAACRLFSALTMLFTLCGKSLKFIIIINCMLKKFTYIFEYLHATLKVNVHCELLYDHMVGPLFLQNMILKETFNLKNYNCLFSYKLKNIKVNNKH